MTFLFQNSIGMEYKRIDPITAFLRIHGGPVTFYKHSHRRFDPVSGQEDNTWGMGVNSNTVNIFSVGEFSVDRFGKGDEILAKDNYIRFITHEMGHVFDHAIDEKGRDAVPANLSIGNTDTANGFCGKKTTYNAGWQWRFSNDDWEYFADMFVGWVYSCWEPTTPQSNLGQLRSDFMKEHMAEWLYNKIEGRSVK